MHDLKKGNGWVIGCCFTCVCGFIAHGLCADSQSSTVKTVEHTVVIWRIQVNFDIFVTEISGKKWPNLPNVHVHLRFMRWSHTSHQQDRVAWRYFSFGEFECKLSFLPQGEWSHLYDSLQHQCNTHFHTDLNEAETIQNNWDRNISNVSHNVYSNRIYSLWESQCRICYSKPFFLIKPVPLIAMVQENNNRTDYGFENKYILQPGL